MERHPIHRGRPSGLWPQVGTGIVAVGAVLIAVAAAESTTTTIHGVAYLHPDQALLNFGVAVVIAGFVLVGALIVLAIGQWIQGQISPFRVECDPEKYPGCREVFPNGTQSRVHVENKRGLGLERVRMQIKRVLPVGYESLAHRIHDASVDKQSSKDGCDLGPKDSILFDIAWLQPEAVVPEFAEEHVRSMQALLRPLAEPGIILELRAEGWHDGWAVRPMSKSFLITVDEKADVLHVREVKRKEVLRLIRAASEIEVDHGPHVASLGTTEPCGVSGVSPASFPGPEGQS